MIKVEDSEIPIITLLLKTLKEVEDATANIRTAFKEGGGDIALLDYEPFHELLDIYGVPGDTLLYCRDGMNEAYHEYLTGRTTVEALVEQIVEVVKHVGRLYKEHGDEIYAPFDMEQYLTLHPEGFVKRGDADAA